MAREMQQQTEAGAIAPVFPCDVEPQGVHRWTLEPDAYADAWREVAQRIGATACRDVMHAQDATPAWPDVPDSVVAGCVLIAGDDDEPEPLSAEEAQKALTRIYNRFLRRPPATPLHGTARELREAMEAEGFMLVKAPR